MAQQQFKILADVNIIPAVVEQLRLRGVEADRLIDLLPQNTKDPDILQFAYDNGYTIVTHDKRIPGHVNARIAAGKQYLGVFIALEHLQGIEGVGGTVEELVFWHEAIVAGAASLQNDVYNQIRWI